MQLIINYRRLIAGGFYLARQAGGACPPQNQMPGADVAAAGGLGGIQEP